MISYSHILYLVVINIFFVDISTDQQPTAQTSSSKLEPPTKKIRIGNKQCQFVPSLLSRSLFILT